MAEPRLSVHDRVMALERLESVAVELNAIAAWLGGYAIETEADTIDRAARDLLASCWLLSRPLRAELSPERWQQPDPYPPDRYLA
jgi:hypothetical protein